MDFKNLTHTTACSTSPPGTVYVNTALPIPPPYLQAIAVIVYTLLSVLTVGGNALVYLTVFHFIGIASVTNLFIANLAVTDFGIGLFCIPIVLVSDYLLTKWPFGTFLCKSTSFAQSVFVVCTVYTLIAMSVDRYVAIIHPLNPKLTRKQCQLFICLLWAFSILFSSPIFIDMDISHTCFRSDPNNTTEYLQTMCQAIRLPQLLQTIYNFATIITVYLIPLCVLTTIYIRLGWHLYQSRVPGEAHSERDAKLKSSKQKVIKMCFIVVIMFGICWLPMQLYTNILHLYLDKIFDQDYIPHIYFAFHLMAMSNSCVNPIIYCVMSSKFRTGYLHYWHCLITCAGSLNPNSRNRKDQNENISMINSLPLNHNICELSVEVPNIKCGRTRNASIPYSVPLISPQIVSSDE